MPISIRSPLEERLKAWHGEEWHTTRGRLIRDIVYAIDTGLVTTISFIAGISVSLAARNQVILAGLVEVGAGTLAIFFGSYISAKAQKHFFESQIDREKREIEEDPQKETQEIRDIFSDMGFTEQEQEMAVRRITADKERWLKFMVQEEIGISPGLIDNPLHIGLISAGSFLVGAFPVILPFFFFEAVTRAFIVSAAAVLVFLFVLGIAKARITKVRWFKSALETLIIGGISCGLGFFLGRIVTASFH
ncbi:MAG: VIT1/CCC1 transporter family protein [Candidatus Omnitrophota bacterium]|nr:MAG: VIT1/CCC1 transporter family protein [Candidatus Omnitrophota bacterium]